MEGTTDAADSSSLFAQLCYSLGATLALLAGFLYARRLWIRRRRIGQRRAQTASPPFDLREQGAQSKSGRGKLAWKQLARDETVGDTGGESDNEVIGEEHDNAPELQNDAGDASKHKDGSSDDATAAELVDTVSAEAKMEAAAAKAVTKASEARRAAMAAARQHYRDERTRRDAEEKEATEAEERARQAQAAMREEEEERERELSERAAELLKEEEALAMLRKAEERVRGEAKALAMEREQSEQQKRGEREAAERAAALAAALDEKRRQEQVWHVQREQAAAARKQYHADEQARWAAKAES